GGRRRGLRLGLALALVAVLPLAAVALLALVVLATVVVLALATVLATVVVLALAAVLVAPTVVVAVAATLPGLRDGDALPGRGAAHTGGAHDDRTREEEDPQRSDHELMSLPHAVDGRAVARPHQWAESHPVGSMGSGVRSRA